jgi:ubiquinol-cytochrome c reductase cytochrome c1 subunit
MPRLLSAAMGAVLALGACGLVGHSAWAAEEPAAAASTEAPAPPKQQWSFNGVFGTYDRAALQRGFQVYKEVCSSCHPVKHLFFRDLEQIGYTEDQVKGIASQYQVSDGPNDQGQMFQRPARPSDPIPGPFPNDEAARAANNGALPPDLSLITKARDGGADYVFSIPTGYKDAPAGFKMNPNMYYNTYFQGHQIAMPPPLQEGQVKFADGTTGSVAQMTHDVVTFLSWAAEPSLDERHRMGFKVILFLLVMTLLFYAAKRRIWSRIDH